ncbi:hypothetical protein BT69DRAFT_1306445 [Atractiella rhizophila]|nr:hypothetical protein BT69DRAFT_1306445 [Atractiella rhizophila]
MQKKMQANISIKSKQQVENVTKQQKYYFEKQRSSTSLKDSRIQAILAKDSTKRQLFTLKEVAPQNPGVKGTRIWGTKSVGCRLERAAWSDGAKESDRTQQHGLEPTYWISKESIPLFSFYTDLGHTLIYNAAVMKITGSNGKEMQKGIEAPEEKDKWNRSIGDGLIKVGSFKILPDYDGE